MRGIGVALELDGSSCEMRGGGGRPSAFSQASLAFFSTGSHAKGSNSFRTESDTVAFRGSVKGTSKSEVCCCRTSQNIPFQDRIYRFTVFITMNSNSPVEASWSIGESEFHGFVVSTASSEASGSFKT